MLTCAAAAGACLPASGACLSASGACSACVRTSGACSACVRSLLCLRQEPACLLQFCFTGFTSKKDQEGYAKQRAPPPSGRRPPGPAPPPYRPTAPGPPPPPCRGLLCGGDPAGCPPPGGSSGRNPREVSGAGIGGQPQGLVVLGGASEPTVQGLSQGECVRLLTRKHTSTWPQTGSGGPICPPSLTYPVSLVSPPCCDFLCPVIAQLP